MRRVLVAAAALGLVIAGCGDEPETGSVAGTGNGGEQAGSEPDDGESDDGAVDEEEPDLPEPITGEQQFPPNPGDREDWPEFQLAMAWVEARHRAQEDFDTSWAEELSLPGCIGCEHLIEFTQELEENGGEIQGGRFSPTEAMMSPRGDPEAGEDVEFRLTLEREPYTITSDAGAEPDEYDGYQAEHYFLMTVVDGEWKIKNTYEIED